MYKSNNEKIGKHLSELIKRSFKSDRQFCKEYLRLINGREPDSVEIQNMANRISPMLKGKKGIQIEDLPYFSDLLGVTIDDILSAGTATAPVVAHKCNYSIALSNDQKEWERYINREDKAFLNPDEFNKTIIDYALEVGNFKFLKYLIDNKYIWFVGDNPEEYYLGFGAGTSVKRREPNMQDLLQYRLKESDDLRFRMISLAIDSKDFSMLDTLKAKEIPELYNVSPFFFYDENLKKLRFTDNTRRMIESISKSVRTVLTYFFSEYEVRSIRTDTSNTFIFPYAGKVLDLLIKSGRKAETRTILEKAISHNKKVSKCLNDLTSRTESTCIEYYKQNDMKYVDSRLECWRDYYFYAETGFIAYRTPIFITGFSGLVTNVIRVTVSSKDPDIQYLIDELNSSFDYFSTLLKNKEDKNAQSNI